MSLQGTDISHYQKVGAGDGYEFVICKATEGVGYVDPICDQHYQRAKANGQKLGVYHFARPEANGAIAEADFFVDNIKGYIKEAILVLDWESSGKANVGWAKQWLDRVYERTGVKPLIYMSSSVVNSYDWSAVAGADYGLWVANYGNNDGSMHPLPEVKYWKMVAMHQYTSKPQDKDIFFGDRSAWDKYAGGAPSGQPDPAPAKKSNEQIANEVIAGMWGDGDDRKNRLAAAGYDYNAVQAIVNQKMGANKPAYKTYVVKKGDTLSGIAKMFGTTYQKIAADNGIANPNKIFPGQFLKIK